MLTDINPSIETLPIELIHRIFDNIDTETILFSIRLVSKLFQAIVDIYDRFDLNFQLISKTNFSILCRLINPQNTSSLTLSNNDRTLNQIDLFISLIHLKQFTRLHSLTLLDINELQLNFILEHFNFNIINSLTFNIRKYDDSWTNTIINFLSLIISQSTLHRLEFYIKPETTSKISWPINCTIRKLIINNGINIDDLYKIFQSSPYLNTLIMSEFPIGIIENLSSIFFEQLTSLTIRYVCVDINELESFLLLTPSLIHLKLIDGKEMMNGKRWEEFIQRNLSQLNKFEFYFTELRSVELSLIDLQLIINSFQTPFWIKHKKWFVICECERDYLYTTDLYSLPICKSFIYYKPKSKKISFSTHPSKINNNLSIMNNIKSLRLDWTKFLADDIQEKKATTNHPLFPKVTEIYIEFIKNWPLLSLESLSIYIDISRIVQMEILSIYFNEYNQNIWIDISNFIKQAHNLSSLIIQNKFDRSHLEQNKNNIYSILPRHIKYLEIPLDNLDRIKIILERCENLSIIKFHYETKDLSQEIINWFFNNTINTICQERYRTVSVWLGKKNFQLTKKPVNSSNATLFFKRIHQFFRK